MDRRLQNLENNIAELRELKAGYSFSDIKRDKKKEWALRYGLLESIQIVIDLSCHLAVHQNLGNAETYSECIQLLGKFDIINQELEDRLVGMAGLRNILVHEYVAVDVERLVEFLDHLDDFTAFANAVSEKFSE
ncbi:type VII toxin-antitoxin system HepT family RNase toxin [Fodinibius halophilus]|uniref:DUF86 domain-containing protein n=1 Tax=Fodinibius halophilus TaxID=1736908 RepID=A0A6M1SY60_9BACT|nr:DUF86 domain-containing protein [Fodinibius halophilus]NGP88336.1 DUF86 domain-containing protein [Fodinibius halophilus]